MLPEIARRLGDVPGMPLLLEQRRRLSPGRVAPGRFEYSFIEFVIFAALLLGVTFLGLRWARGYRAKRDENMTASSGGWRFRTQLDIDAGSPFNRFPDLALAMPHDVMEGQEDDFEVAYFNAYPRRGSPVVPYALVQLPVDPPKGRFVAEQVPDVNASIWGPAASRLLADARGVVVETAPLALLVRSDGASAEAVGRFALALAKAVVEDARGPAH